MDNAKLKLLIKEDKDILFKFLITAFDDYFYNSNDVEQFKKIVGHDGKIILTSEEVKEIIYNLEDPELFGGGWIGAYYSVLIWSVKVNLF